MAPKDFTVAYFGHLKYPKYNLIILIKICRLQHFFFGGGGGGGWEIIFEGEILIKTQPRALSTFRKPKLNFSCSLYSMKGTFYTHVKEISVGIMRTSRQEWVKAYNYLHMESLSELCRDHANISARMG